MANLQSSSSQPSLDDRISVIWKQLCTLNPMADLRGYEALSREYDDLCLERDLFLLWQE